MIDVSECCAVCCVISDVYVTKICATIRLLRPRGHLYFIILLSTLSVLCGVRACVGTNTDELCFIVALTKKKANGEIYHMFWGQTAADGTMTMTHLCWESESSALLKTLYINIISVCCIL